MNTRNTNKKKVLLFVIVIVAVVAVIVGAVLLIERGTRPSQGTNSKQRITQQTLYFGDDEYNITHNVDAYLLIGVDDAQQVEAPDTEQETDASGNLIYRDEDGDILTEDDVTFVTPSVPENGYVGQMADFLLLLIMDRTENTYGLVQVNRNTMTDVPMMDAEGNGEGTAFEQICVAHWYGGDETMGCENTEFCVSELFGELEINGYYQIDMDDIAVLNRAVGGVEVTLEDDFTDIDPAMKKGTTLTLTDEQAQSFVRARMEIGEGDNASRMRRQKAFMENFRQKAFDKISEDASFADTLLSTLQDSAVTNMPKSVLSKIINQIYKSSYLGMFEFEGETREADTFHEGVLHEEFYADTASIANIAAMLCAIDESHILRYEEDSEEIDAKFEAEIEEEEKYEKDEPLLEDETEE